jgi:hypothetical protein
MAGLLVQSCAPYQEDIGSTLVGTSIFCFLFAFYGFVFVFENKINTW